MKDPKRPNVSALLIRTVAIVGFNVSLVMALPPAVQISINSVAMLALETISDSRR